MTLFHGVDGLHGALHETQHDAKFRGTHLGQAHVAGSGPAGKTCRECSFYGKGLKNWPDYYAGGELKNNLKQATCRNPIPGKSNRKFPHYARACLLFEQREDVPAIIINPDEKDSK